MPGLGLQMDSLFQKTSKLPQIKIKESNIAIGNDTESCILSGVIRGQAASIDGLLAQCENELGESAKILLTGGYSKLITKYTNRKFDEINPNLTLEGIRLAYEEYLVSR
jgi:type III pantothenate kinase